MPTKIESLTLVAKAIFKTIILPWILPLTIIGGGTLFILHQNAVIKKQKKIISQYRDSLDRLNKNYNTLYKELITTDITLNQVSNQIGILQHNFWKLQHNFNNLAHYSKQCVEEKQKFKQQINSLYRQINKLYNLANKYNKTKAAAEQKHTR